MPKLEITEGSGGEGRLGGVRIRVRRTLKKETEKDPMTSLVGNGGGGGESEITEQ